MEIKVIKSRRKTMSLSVDDNLVPVVKAPYFTTDKQIYAFVNAHSKWLDNAVEKKRNLLEKYNLTDAEVNELIKKAREFIPERVCYYSSIIGVKPVGIKITRARKRFGSCSSKNSLCFSCYLMLYPEQAIDYVVVHELAHIRQHNHSAEFYKIISEAMPDYKERERLLK